jgi:hypothetical protein
MEKMSALLLIGSMRLAPSRDHSSYRVGQLFRVRSVDTVSAWITPRKMHPFPGSRQDG